VSDRKLRIVVLTHGDARFLVREISRLARVQIVGVITETNTEPERRLFEKLRRSLKYDGLRATLLKAIKPPNKKTVIGNIRRTQNELESFTKSHNLPFFRIDNFHSDEGRELLKSLDADLGILYGTNIIRETVFSIPRLGAINLHQGLAPLYRGGPTVFWELYNGEREIGITVHFVAAKVDTGDVILQKTIPMNYDFSKYGLEYDAFISDIRQSLKEPSVKMIVDSVEMIANKQERRQKQDLSIGKRYRLPTHAQKNEMKRILKTRMREQKRNGSEI
jgi:methionyl-tRNA formyltransferase